MWTDFMNHLWVKPSLQLILLAVDWLSQFCVTCSEWLYVHLRPEMKSTAQKLKGFHKFGGR